MMSAICNPWSIFTAARISLNRSEAQQQALLVSDSPQGKLRFGLPLHALRFYFPALWPEDEADEEGPRR